MMMSTDVYKLTWKHFNVNQDTSLKAIFSNNENADVTLVSDDKVAFPAHKFILSACSPVFKDLLLKNPHPHPMIYLNGVKRFDLDSLLQFIYFGKTQFFQSRMEKFFEIGKDLQIEQMSQPFDNTNAKDASVFDEISEEPKTRKEDVLMRDELDGERDLLVQEEDISIKSYSCEKCATTVFNSIQQLSFHRKIQHAGTRYKCENCQYKTSHLSHLKQHKAAIHEGVRYSCDSCDYKSTHPSNLKKHKESIHEGVTYSCDICDYKASQVIHLKLHKASIHEEVSFSCDQCEYNTSWRSNLSKHKKRKHFS